MTAVLKRKRGPILFMAAGGLFLLGAVRDAFFPHFFTTQDGSPAAGAGLAVVFLTIGAAQLRSHRASEEAERRK